MKVIFSLLFGGASAAAATLLHLLWPPFGLILALVGTFTTFWSIGRHYGRRRYKVWASLGWLIIFFKGALFGAGSEILVQGDNLGLAFTLLSFATIVLAILWRN